MNKERIQELLIFAEFLAKQMTLIAILLNSKFIRLGISAMVKATDTINGKEIPREEPLFLNFYKPETVPPEFKIFLNEYLVRLKKQYSAAWDQLNELGYQKE